MNKYRIFILIILLIAGISAGVYIYYPSIHAAAVYREMAERAGVVRRDITDNGYRVHYYESAADAGEPLILLHGLGGDKTSFLESAVTLKNKFHLIFPDLAGHGENAAARDSDYSIDGQAEFLYRFVSAKRLVNFNLGGNSMGGHVAAAFTLKYPQMVKSLVLIDSAGISTEGNSAYTGYGAPINSFGELRTAMSFAYRDVPARSITESLYMIRNYNRNRNFIISTLIPCIRYGRYFDLTDDLWKITAPTLIIWGAGDRVITLEVAERFRHLIKGSELVVIDNASHCPQLEDPERVSREITHYIIPE